MSRVAQPSRRLRSARASSGRSRLLRHHAIVAGEPCRGSMTSVSAPRRDVEMRENSSLRVGPSNCQSPWGRSKSVPPSHKSEPQPSIAICGCIRPTSATALGRLPSAHPCSSQFAESSAAKREGLTARVLFHSHRVQTNGRHHTGHSIQFALSADQTKLQGPAARPYQPNNSLTICRRSRPIFADHDRPRRSRIANVFEESWSGREDLNLRPLGPEPSALPD
jgi:hypothetical protein